MPRTCLGCRGKFDRNLLLRVVRVSGGDGEKIIKYDPDSKLQGRGAWVCKKNECIDKAKKSRSFERTLKARIMEDVYEELTCAARKKFFPF